ncbi:MAG: L-type lectin-domain containing protein [bacterium]|nr:L-type lectin-domain containing protein [bacterium]
MKRLLLLFLLSPIALEAQQFHLIGNADEMGNGCIMLTPDLPYAEGIAYSRQKLDLTRNFQIDFDIFLGDKNEGADGITFVVHDDVRSFNAFGSWGECMGYGRFSPGSGGNSIDPSIAIEFDTYQNRFQNDPSSDHVAYLENGINQHLSYWNNQDEGFDLEDDYLHSFQFQWEAESQTIRVYLDGNEVYKGNRDLVNDIFNGNSDVIWGFTASTGRKHNLQYFCLKRLAMEFELEDLDKAE